MKTSKYIILTPIAPYKLYSLNRFLKNVMSFRPKPKEMVFCTEPEIVPKISKWNQKLKKQGIKLIIFTLEPKIINKYSDGHYFSLEKIKEGRECLRHYFIESKFDWALWLDSDIIPKPNVAEVLLEIAQSEKFLAVTNQYPGKKEGCHWSGIACTLTHKVACTLSRFEIGYATWGKEKIELCEDYCFLSMLDSTAQAIKRQTGWSGRKVGKFVSVYHEIKPGVTRFIKKNDKSGGPSNPNLPTY